MSKDFSKQINSYQTHKPFLETGPSVIYIESVNGCPYSCAMCMQRHTKISKISVDLLSKLEPYFADLEVLGIHGSGEPLLGDLTYFVNQSIKHDFVIHMNTTGFFLTRAVADLLLQTRLSIRFSIHAGRPETYAKIMGNDLYRVRDNISYLIKKSKQLDKAYDFWFSFIVMKENIDEIEDFLYLANNCGIKHVRFMRLAPNPQSLRGVKMNDRNFTFNYFEQFNQAIIDKFYHKFPEYKRISQRLGINIEYAFRQQKRTWHILGDLSNKITQKIFNMPLFPLRRPKGECAAPFIGQLIINQKGQVKLCCSAAGTIGDLNRFTLNEIWNSTEMQQIRKSFKNGYYPRQCRYCRGFGLEEYPHNAFVDINKVPDGKHRL
jgi:radical SAM protein with 4Fe4S-binding SPASM domain